MTFAMQVPARRCSGCWNREKSDQYAQASKPNKVTLAPQIRILEAKVEQQKADLKKQELQIRKEELSK